MYKQVLNKENTYYYLEEGGTNKETILFLHGAYDSAEMFTFSANMLAKHYHVLALDFPMIREDGQIENINSLTDYVKGFLEVLGVEKPIIVGFSLGGLVAIDYASHYPKKVSKIYVLSCAPQLLCSAFEQFLFRLVKNTLLARSSLYCISRLNTSSFFRRLLDMPILPPETVQRQRKYYYPLFGTAINILDASLTDKLNTLPVQSTLAIAMDDHVISWQRYKQQILDLTCQKYIFDQGGHAVDLKYWNNILSLFVDSKKLTRKPVHHQTPAGQLSTVGENSHI